MKERVEKIKYRKTSDIRAADEEKTGIDSTNEKVSSLMHYTELSAEEFLTTNQGIRVNDNHNSLKAGERGPTLLEDFLFREKITHFDHERIPERVVHARGAGAHGYFQVYKSMAKYTKAKFLTDPTEKTPVFVRFSTVAGSRGSTDLARDVRGFAVKFYTKEGNYDLVANNMPVFFIQDAIKFPDFVHAVKPEPHNEIPQASSAHDTFWDFISLTPESMHMVMWLMSDRAIPRSFRMMEGFGVHTFRLINEDGESVFVKFHWKPLLGVHSVVWEEAQMISGKDPDFHRRDLWKAIETGAFPEWELGVQIIPEDDEDKYEFDLLDPTKIVPEELVPVQCIGKMTLNRNPDNFFAETEQVAFHPGNVVPGIDFTNDPLLQGRLFSYIDTQLTRLGGPNFHEIPINRPIAPVHNNQRDGHMRQTINRGNTSYQPNTIEDGYPIQAKSVEGGFTSYTERIEANKIRGRSRSFFDHFSQATLFYNSQSNAEKKHIIDAFSFELGKVKRVEIRQRMLGLLNQVDETLATNVADALGLAVPGKPEYPMNHIIPADGDPKEYQPVKVEQSIKRSEALSMANTVKNTIKSRQIAILAADGVDGYSISQMKSALAAEGAKTAIIAPTLGYIESATGEEIKVDMSFLTAASVLFDAVYVPGGPKSSASLKQSTYAIQFIYEAYKHCKAIAVDDEGVELLKVLYPGNKTFSDTLQATDLAAKGIIMNVNKKGVTSKDFIKAIAQHRFWIREEFFAVV
ncbi:MAG: catalase HPII [Candidatus Methanoperedens sp.]|nr:catalase HPII [Candidatus Methanoperedens sp.]